jgi:hypothetical protein
VSARSNRTVAVFQARSIGVVDMPDVPVLPPGTGLLAWDML